ncbi:MULTISPECIES: 2-succinyl-6-hydroxy-2,4-cyclohexadiene-1-carboxylate synthase [Vibrio]|uniref:2-succinyl-6-hydroxy-2, 4-cyclohexadiene-1-carboxylate synthase n=1 Tax=Vibrio TaxID=662 RepID=UPI0001B94AF1|nr:MULTISPECIES: 2-succinyl-6-hydroxy-2,4-cyclohexadiene-1-carboxylate synthase [Vibrio]EEX37456.1 2-succinyl-6-hydroxy-2,4-cyclohexadiene-1-carboxylate synthase [Vibrio metschnikovii CIP 69.14]NNN59790.1 2-succinyl-6-hydroxy-2,4-cyclohexadiene-1-carboxylate synthase [Vibrio sp. A11]SUP08602.1 acyl-CoA thioester hydrolase YfbB [Vibrio metschnikovii]SUP51678.1 acyl-CoA thioester hydrolase YfbB [Vibrio metschnikovii]
MLYSQWLPKIEPAQPAQNNAVQPVVVFLHGFLGSSQDWQMVVERLRGVYSLLLIDLPGHGQSRHLGCSDFADVCQQIAQVVTAHCPPTTPLWLVGYSLGARLAMLGCTQGWFDALNIQGLVIEGGHFGLTTEEEKNARWQHDQHWAARFAHQPIAQVLTDWYQQAVFSSLNHEQRQTLVTLRSDNLGSAVAGTLLATSLARQPDTLPKLQCLPFSVYYVCGQNDAKFYQLAQQSDLHYHVVEQAGHNVHHECPESFAHLVTRLVASSNNRT